MNKRPGEPQLEVENSVTEHPFVFNVGYQETDAFSEPFKDVFTKKLYYILSWMNKFFVDDSPSVKKISALIWCTHSSFLRPKRVQCASPYFVSWSRIKKIYYSPPGITRLQKSCLLTILTRRWKQLLSDRPSAQLWVFLHDFGTSAKD